MFAADTPLPAHARAFGVQVRLGEFKLRRPRQWGACWAVCRLWQQLGLDEFWRARLADSREGTSWYHVLMVLVGYRWIDPGSEWRLHRQWFETSAMGDLLGEDFALVAKDTLYRCLDKLLVHRDALFGFLHQRWQDLFGVSYEILLYDLTSTYFESNPPFAEGDKRRFFVRVVFAFATLELVRDKITQRGARALQLERFGKVNHKHVSQFTLGGFKRALALAALDVRGKCIRHPHRGYSLRLIEAV